MAETHSADYDAGEVAAILAKHRLYGEEGDDTYECGCGAESPPEALEEDFGELAWHERHVAGLVATNDREMKAFVAGWFAKARNPKDAPFLVEDAWHAYRLLASAERVIPPAQPPAPDADSEAGK